MSDRLPVISRPRQGAVIGGVCAGLARRLGMEPKAVRIIAVISVIALGGLGAALYLAGLVLLPRDGETEPPLTRALPFTRAWPRWTVVAAVIGLCVAVTWGSGAGPVLVPVAIVGLVIWLSTRRGRATTVAEPTPFERAADAWRTRLAEEQVPGFAVTPRQQTWQQTWQQPYTDPSDSLVADGPAPVQPLLPQRTRRSWRGWGLTLALVGGFTGVVAVLGVVLGVGSTPLAYTAAVLAGLGVGLLASARSGRPPLLITATVITALVLGGQAAFGQFGELGKVGDVNTAYTSASQVPAGLNVSAGDATLDFSRLTLDADRTMTVHVRAGDVRLTLPSTVNWTLDWTVPLGDVTFASKPMGELGVNGPDGSLSSDTASGGTGPTLHLVVKVDVGDLVVTP